MNRPAMFESAYYLAEKHNIVIEEAFQYSVKTYDYYLQVLKRLVRNLYNNYIAGQFIDILQSLIQGQLTQAWYEGMRSNNLFPEDILPEWEDELQAFIQSEYLYIEGFYRDIIDAQIDQTPIEPLLKRAELWANRYNDVVNRAKIVTAQKGKKKKWVFGDTDHCHTCEALNGIVLYAKEWEELRVYPQNPPNHALTCGGWKCDCRLEDTEERRTYGGYDRVLTIVTSTNL